MQYKSKSAIIIFIFILVSISACTGNGMDDPHTSPPFTEKVSNTTPGNLCDNALYPIKQGATWTYASAGGPGGSFTYTDTITSTRADGFTITSQFADLMRAQEWTCQADGLKALQLGGGTAAGLSTLGMTAAFTTSEITGISIPKEITSGMQWNYSLKMQGTMAMPGDQQAQSDGTYSVMMQEMGTESITVPAGVFEAIKIQANSAIEIITIFEGVEVPIKFNGTTISWYVPGIGFVKSVENGDFGGTTFSAMTELQSYNIP